jgi:hypothetical protein
VALRDQLDVDRGDPFQAFGRVHQAGVLAEASLARATPSA